MLKAGDLIKCTDADECRYYLKALEKEGYGAVVTDIDCTYIRITSVPEKGGGKSTW